MVRLCVIAERPASIEALRPALAKHFETQFFLLDRLPETAPEEFTLVDVDLRAPEPCQELRGWLKRRPRTSKVVFCVRRDSHAEAVQARALGATALIGRPVTGEALLKLLMTEGPPSDATEDGLPEDMQGVGAGAAALHDLFDSVLNGRPIDVPAVDVAGRAVVSTIEEAGLSRWVHAVRQHHSHTYQHCLLVTGVAVGFGRSLGFTAADQRRVAVAGLLHDIGKAKIPLAILEKDGPLSDAEMNAMRKHPLYGLQAVEASPALQPEMLDMIVHHHEYLDGSGYPHGLMGNSISDLVRTITISDIYSALLERRSYKAPLAPADAYAIVSGMHGKLDKDLVREFRAIARA